MGRSRFIRIVVEKNKAIHVPPRLLYERPRLYGVALLSPRGRGGL